MSEIGMLLRTLAEVGVVIALLFGFMRENKFVKAERKAWRFLRVLRRKAHDAREKELERELLDAQYADEYETERRSKPSVKKTAGGKKKRKSSRDRVA
ncbi:MAG: hypothetical protein IJT41_04205 [Clostridia bacterium]|nr:hypothetical protein [Clostridia bacterium]